MRNCAKCANEGTECGGRTGHDGGGPPHRGGGPPHGGGGPPHGGGGPPHGGGGPPHGGSPSGGGHSGGARPPSGGEHRGAHDRQTNRSFATNTSHHQTQHQHHVHYHAESRSSKTIHHNSPHSNTKPNHNPPHPQSRKKTIMVRTNSVQCIPVQENKSTTCNHDDRISMTRLDKFLSQLRGSKTRTDVDVKNEIDSTAKDSGDFKKPAIQLNTKDITALTKAKLRNYFLEGDVYMSPVSGRNYDLSYRNIEVPSQIVNTNTKLLKPLDINEQLQYAKLPTECFTSETEHTKLMTAICEAVLSSTGRQNELEVPTKETKEINTPNTSPPTSPHADTLHTISEDNESVNSIRNTAAINVASTIKPSYKDESESINLRSEEMCEVQRNFKDKIEKLEGKIQELMSKTQTNTENKAIPKERSRSPRPHLHQTKQNQKTINEHKPFVTKTGLFGAMPTRSQLFAGNVSKKAHPANAHQHGDDVADNNKKIQDDSIVKYENLVADNQRHVDDLLGQLEVLRNGNDKKDVKKDDICCLEPTGSMLYNPDMGTGEIFTAKLKNQNKNENTPSKELFNQLEHLFTDNARGETVFYVNEIHYDDLGPSTSASVKDNTDIIYESADASSEQQKPLDFSSIVFTSSSGIVPNSGEKDMGNFILENLPSYSTSISDSYIVEQMLRQDQSVYGSSNSILSEVDNLNISLPNTCNTSVCDDVNSKSKVQ